MRQQVRFIGRVQGVGFRATARQVARGYHISGWVRNEPDGSVILEAQGTPEDLEAFLAELDEMTTGLVKLRHIGDLAELPGEREFVIAP